MVILLASLLTVYLYLGIGRSKVPKAIRYLVHLPFSVYLGWITIATIVNVTVVLLNAGWDRFGLTETFWAMTMLIAGAILALLMLFTRKDIFFTLVVAWAFLGIWIRQTDPATTVSSSLTVGTAALILTGILMLGVAIQAIRGRTY
jgi:hypothetical protein